MRIVIILIILNLGLFYMGSGKRESMRLRREFISKSNTKGFELRGATDEAIIDILEINKHLELRGF